MSMAQIGVKIDAGTVPAGNVTFVVTNVSRDIIHEMIRTPATADGVLLPYVSADYKVDETAAGHLGEVSDLDPGKSGTPTMDLEPGEYTLSCNIPAHFMAGIWAEITVKQSGQDKSSGRLTWFKVPSDDLGHGDRNA